MQAHKTPILLGRVVGTYGVRGWVKIHSECRPREALFQYKRFFIAENRVLQLRQGRLQGQSLVAHFVGIDDMNQAEALRGTELYVEALKPLPQGQYYWQDLIGLTVENRQGIVLGQVKTLFETGANDVLVVENEGREILIPYAIPRYLERVDLAAGRLYVDWEADWND